MFDKQMTIAGFDPELAAAIGAPTPEHPNALIAPQAMVMKQNGNIFPGTTIAKYWSLAVTFKTIQLAVVLKNKPKTELAMLSIALLILAKAPMASIIPPKTMAQMISHTVPNIPCMPPEENNSFKRG